MLSFQSAVSFPFVGQLILSEITGILAENSISVFAISTYNTDYVLIKEDVFEKAMDILEQSGYKIVE